MGVNMEECYISRFMKGLAASLSSEVREMMGEKAGEEKLQLFPMNNSIDLRNAGQIRFSTVGSGYSRRKVG